MGETDRPDHPEDTADSDEADEAAAPAARWPPEPKRLTPKELLTVLLEDMEAPTSPRDPAVSRERLQMWVTLVATALAQLDGEGDAGGPAGTSQEG
jgi:hypothetical protein